MSTKDEVDRICAKVQAFHAAVDADEKAKMEQEPQRMGTTVNSNTVHMSCTAFSARSSQPAYVRNLIQQVDGKGPIKIPMGRQQGKTYTKKWYDVLTDTMKISFHKDAPE